MRDFVQKWPCLSSNFRRYLREQCEVLDAWRSQVHRHYKKLYVTSVFLRASKKATLACLKAIVVTTEGDDGVDCVNCS